MIDAPSAPAPATRWPAWRRNLWVLWIANFLTSVGLMALLPFFAPFVRQLGETDPRRCELWAGIIVGAGPFMAAVLSGFWGAVGDRVGRKRMVIRALCAITIFVGAMALARAPWQLLVLRIWQGAFSGYVAPTLTLVSVLAPLDRQGRVGGSLQTSVLAGAVMGPWLSSLVEPAIGYGGIAFVCALLSALSAAIVAAFVVEPPRAAPVVPARRGVTRMFTDATRELGRALRRPGIGGLLVALLLVRTASASVNPTLVTHVETLLGGISVEAHRIASWVFSAQPLATLVFLPVFGRLADRRGSRIVLLTCVLCGALATLAQAFTHSAWTLGAWRLVAGGFLAGVLPASVAATAHGGSADRRGGELGLTFSALTFGLAFGPWIGSAIDAYFGYPNLLLASAALLFVAFVILWRPRSVASSPQAAAGSVAPPAA
ncbi:MAG: MFS transporter [Planctomycetes bacterium]|nr:MFS transporter [Planctomycetota bacterium]